MAYKIPAKLRLYISPSKINVQILLGIWMLQFSLQGSFLLILVLSSHSGLDDIFKCCCRLGLPMPWAGTAPLQSNCAWPST